MRAILLDRAREPLRLADVPVPRPGTGQVLIEVAACGVCRTDLHIVDGELPHPKRPLILGHQIIGRVVRVGDDVDGVAEDARVGVPWLGWTCGSCARCTSGFENLCENARFTGYDLDGGYAEFAVAHARYVFAVPGAYDDVSAAPLMCAGLIGYRALRLAGDAPRLGLYGFGAAAHLVAQVAIHFGQEVYAFTRSGDQTGQAFARELGAVWSGASSDSPPLPLDAAIIFAPVGALVPTALAAVRTGGHVVCAGIHMSDIPSFPYELLWGERHLSSVANLTRRDGQELLALAPNIPIRTVVERFPLEAAADALERLRRGQLTGAAVLSLQHPETPSGS